MYNIKVDHPVSGIRLFEIGIQSIPQLNDEKST